MNRLEALRRVLFLKSLPEATLLTIGQAGEEKRLAKGELLFAEHEHCIGLLVVLCGAVKVYKLDSRGRELTLGLERPGCSVVEMPLFDGGNYPASAEATESGTTVLIVPRMRFQEILLANPEIMAQALRTLAVRMRKLLQMLEAQSLHTVRARLVMYLLSVSEERTSFVLPDTNDAIAGHLGTVREVVSRTLRSLKDDGLLLLQGRVVTLCDIDILQRLAAAADI